MTDNDRLAALELTQKELCRNGEILWREVKDIKDNHLKHLALAVEDVRDIAEAAKFRSGLQLYGLAFIGVMITILTVVVALVR